MAVTVNDTIEITVVGKTVAATEISTLTSRDPDPPTSLKVNSLRPAATSIAAPQVFDYTEIDLMLDWRFLHYTKPITIDAGRLTGWVWEHSVPLERRDQEVPSRYWLCTRCYRDTGYVKIYETQRGCASVANHLKKEHELFNRAVKVNCQEIDRLHLDHTTPAGRASINAVAEGFQVTQFYRLLVRWVVRDRIPFIKINSPALQEVFNYLNPGTGHAGAVPSNDTITRRIFKEYGLQKTVVLKMLARAISKIHISFDTGRARPLKMG